MKKIYFLFGDDINEITFRILQISSELSKQSSSPIVVERINLVDFESLENFCAQGMGTNLSLFQETSLLKIYINSKCFKFIEKDLDSFLSKINEISKIKTIVLTFWMENYEKSIRKQIIESPLLKSVSGFSVIEEYQILKFWQKEQIKNKVNDLAIKFDLRFDNNALDLFIDCLKDELENLFCELQKIQVYILPSKLITEQIIMNLYLGGFNIDDLYESIVLQKGKSISTLINKLDKLKTPLYFIASLQHKLRQAFYVKTYAEQSENSFQINKISKITGINPYKTEKVLTQLKNVPLSWLRKVIRQLSELEFRVKSGIVSDKNAIEMLFIQI